MDERARLSDMAELYSITVSPDEMEAYIEVHGFAARFDKIDIVKALRERESVMASGMM